MGDRFSEWRADDCPVCGKEDAARMGSSRWGHNWQCCSDLCGRRLKMRFDNGLTTQEAFALEKGDNISRVLRSHNPRIDSLRWRIKQLERKPSP